MATLSEHLSSQELEFLQRIKDLQKDLEKRMNKSCNEYGTRDEEITD